MAIDYAAEGGSVIGREPTQFDRVSPLQRQNSDGAWTFEVGPLERLERFLILGSEGGSFYASERALTEDNARSVKEAFETSPAKAAQIIAAVSDYGRAPKVSPALFALALGASMKNPSARAAALDVFGRVVRTGGHLLEFVHYVNNLRGWGRGLKRAISCWYENRSADDLAHQLMKYRARQWRGVSMTQRDVLRLCHVSNDRLTQQKQAVVRYVVSRSPRLTEREVFRQNRAGWEGRGESPLVMQHQDALGELPEKLQAYEELQRSTPERIASLVRQYRFSHEMVPKAALASDRVWEALLEHMPMGALVRNVAQLTARGIIDGNNDAARSVAERLGTLMAIRKARLHPLALLSAFRVYARGHGEKGKKVWSPSPVVTAALESGFELAMGNVRPSGGNVMLAIDVSGSMQMGNIAGIPGLTPHEASMAMAIVTLRVEENPRLIGFSTLPLPLDWPKDLPLSEALERTRRLPFGATNCALPMTWSEACRIEIDGFAIYTDNETNQSSMHPHLALQQYRRVMERPSKLAVVAMTSNGFSIADPNDSGMLDVVGFDSRAPSVLGDFLRPVGRKPSRVLVNESEHELAMED